MNKIQFNSNSLKSFRQICSKYHNARHELNDYIATHDEDLKKAKEALETDTNQLFTLRYGKEEDKRAIGRTEDEVKKALFESKEIVDTLTKNLEAAREKCANACKAAEDLVSDSLYEAFKTAKTGREFAGAIAKWLIANGAMDATPENCEGYAFWLGNRSGKNNAKKAAEVGKLSKCISKKQFVTNWLGALVDELQDEGIINAYKYTFQPRKK